MAINTVTSVTKRQAYQYTCQNLVCGKFSFVFEYAGNVCLWSWNKRKKITAG